MTKFRTGVAIAVIMIAAPAMARTDWRAVAAFDAIILERDKMAIAD